MHERIAEFLHSREKTFRLAGMKKAPLKYYSENARVAVAVFSLTAGIAFVMTDSIFIALPAGALLFAVSAALIHFLPEFRAMKNRAMAERQLPFFLFELSIRLKAGQEMLSAITEAGKNDAGLFAVKMREAVECVMRKGESLESALWKTSDFFSSEKISRALSYVFSAYQNESRADLDNLGLLAEEMVERRFSEQRANSGQVSFLVMVFVAVSTIVPAIFISYISVGSLILNTGLGFVEVVLAIAVMFPALDALFLYLVKNRQES